MPDNCEPFDLNNLPDNNNQGKGCQEDLDDIDFGNYKGIYANDEAGQKYQCPKTGAHFEPSDLCRRLNKVMENRKVYED